MKKKEGKINVTIFGKLLRKARLQKDLTISQVARKIGISANYLGNIERGVALPSLEIAHYLSYELNIGLDYLTNEENMTRASDDSIMCELDRTIYSLSNEEKLFLLECVKLYKTKNITRGN